MKFKSSLLLLLGGALALAVPFPFAALAKDTVKIAFIGPLSGGNSAPGLGGRNSAQLAVQLRNADPATKNVGIQVATKAASDNSIIAGITHYCSAVGIATVDTYSRFGLPAVVWGAILPAHRFNPAIADRLFQPAG
jgi:branched-chain amino acid transport system substrate-binding protein